MNVEIIREESGLQALEPHWDRLLEQSATPTPFLRWDWVTLWWQEFRDQYQLVVAVARDEAGNLEGIAPLVIGRDGDGARRHLRQLGFLNGIGPCQGERLDFIVRSGQEAVITPLLFRAIRQTQTDWDVMRLNKVPEESPNFPLLRSAMAECGRDATVLNQSDCVYLDLPNSWEELTLTKDRDWRRKMRKRWQVLTEEQGAQALLGGKEIPAEKAFEDLVQLHALRWPEGISSFLRKSSLNIHRELARRWVPKGWITLPVLHHEGRCIAAIYNIACGREQLMYQVGWHPDYARFSPGIMAIKWAMESAITLNLTRYDFLPGEHGYKRSWSERVRHVSDLECFHPQRTRAALFQLLRAVKRRVSRAPAAAAAAASVSVST